MAKHLGIALLLSRNTSVFVVHKSIALVVSGGTSWCMSQAA